MGDVRPFREQDISQVAELHRRVFHTPPAPSAQLESAYYSYFNRIFLSHPMRHTELPSLVHTEAGGRITGFLGVMPQPMRIRNKSILAAVSSQFIVDPDSRSTLAALQLLKTFISGPQDLSLADEAGEDSRKLWERLGGATAFLYSLYWIRILRPAQFLISRLAKRPGKPIFVAAAKPFCGIADALASKVPKSPFAAVPPDGKLEEPSPEVLLASLTELSRKRALLPAYDSDLMRWYLATLEQRKQAGPLRTGVVRDQNDNFAGCYIYHAKRGGLGEVLQIGAQDNSHGQVLNHLFFDAWRNGVAALSGRLEPQFMEEMRKKHCLLNSRGYWMVVHSRNPGIVQSILSGDAFLTRLEGEWTMRFQDAMFDASGDPKSAHPAEGLPAPESVSAFRPTETTSRST